MKKNVIMKSILIAGFFCIFAGLSLLNAQEGLQQEGLPSGISDSWVATDALGRDLVTRDKAGAPRPDKYVAMFYWTWHTMEGFIKTEPVNVENIISKYPEAMNDFKHPQWTHQGRHHWSEPLFGYYVSNDRWVLRKHAEMLADAGVDVVFFDCTNATLMWDDALHALGEVWSQARKDGIRAPAIVFMCPFWPMDNSPVLIIGSSPSSPSISLVPPLPSV